MGIDSGVYQAFLILHVIAVIAAFGPLFVLPRLAAADRDGAARLHLYLSMPAIVLMWVFGMGLVGMSDDAWEMSDPWIVASLVIFVAALAIGWFLVRPGILNPEARSKLAAGTGITHVLLVVALWLMVVKPG